MIKNRKAKLALGLALVGAAVLIPGTAFAQDVVEPVFDGSSMPAATDIGISLNLLWIVIGAVLCRWWFRWDRRTDS